MNWLTNAWKWLSNTKNQKTIAFIGSELVIVVTGVWQGYLHLYEPNKEPTPSIPLPVRAWPNGNITQTPDRGVNAIITTGDVKIGMSDENVIKLITTIVKENHLDSKTDKEQITNLTLAVEYLNANTFNLGSNEEVTDALKKLSQGDSTKAKELYLRIATDTNKIPNQRAKAYRYIGALASLDYPKPASEVYEKTGKLDPINSELKSENTDDPGRVSTVFDFTLKVLKEALLSYGTKIVEKRNKGTNSDDEEPTKSITECNKFESLLIVYDNSWLKEGSYCAKKIELSDVYMTPVQINIKNIKTSPVAKERILRLIMLLLTVSIACMIYGMIIVKTIVIQ